MLDHLDDPTPPALDERFYRGVLRTARRRRVRNRAALTGAGLTLSAAGAAAFLRAQADQLEQIRVDGLSPATSQVGAPMPTSPTPAGPTAPAPVPATLAPAPPLTAPVNIVFVGMDGRFRDGADPQAENFRADTIAIVRLDPVGGQVRLLSVPRDLYVETATGGSGRINSLAADPSRLVEVIREELGIDLQHLIAVDFDGFIELVDIAGGVAVPFDRPVRDTQIGFEVAESGCYVLDGERALAYARSRFLEVYDSGTNTWHTDATSDFGRVARQQDLIGRLYRQILTADYGAVDQLEVLTDVVDDLTVDAGLDVPRLRELFATAQAIGADNFHSYDLAGAVRNEHIGGAAVLVPDHAAVGAVVDSFLGGAPAADKAPVSADAVVPTASAGCP